ncbi:hypothetical protein B0H13DRAFT_2350620 [Mycena leptocephala]|nr:hypothetical protein B0H13DRAFT_2350620 [Mycena leptocephala]
MSRSLHRAPIHDSGIFVLVQQRSSPAIERCRSHCVFTMHGVDYHPFILLHYLDRGKAYRILILTARAMLLTPSFSKGEGKSNIHCTPLLKPAFSYCATASGELYDSVSHTACFNTQLTPTADNDLLILARQLLLLVQQKNGKVIVKKTRPHPAIQVGAIGSFITSRNRYASGDFALPLGLWLLHVKPMSM